MTRGSLCVVAPMYVASPFSAQVSIAGITSPPRIKFFRLGWPGQLAVSPVTLRAPPRGGLAFHLALCVVTRASLYTGRLNTGSFITLAAVRGLWVASSRCTTERSSLMASPGTAMGDARSRESILQPIRMGDAEGDGEYRVEPPAGEAIAKCYDGRNQHGGSGPDIGLGMSL
jgi:hypothetical protein